jgi:hypothetical protein
VPIGYEVSWSPIVFYALGRAVFEPPRTFRDETTYILASPDETWSLRVTPMPEAKDANDALQSAKDAVTDFFGPLVVYCNPTKIPSAAGPVSAYEGEMAEPGQGPPKRFAVAALAYSASRVSFLLFGPRQKLLAEMERLLRSARFDANPPDPPPRAGQGLTQRRAGAVLFHVPGDWSFPTTFLFSDPDKDDVRLRLTLDDPVAAEGQMDPVAELPAVPGDRVTVQKKAVTPGRPNPKSWTGEWTVEHGSPLGKKVLALCKACIVMSGSEVMTIHGQALDKNAGRLTAGWEVILQTFRERMP